MSRELFKGFTFRQLYPCTRGHLDNSLTVSHKSFLKLLYPDIIRNERFLIVKTLRITVSEVPAMVRLLFCHHWQNLGHTELCVLLVKVLFI